MIDFFSRNDLEVLCVELSEDPLLVQGAGGNLSVKEGGTLWIKASGTWLSEAKEKNIFIPISLPAVSGLIEEGHFDVLPTALNGESKRPSIETWLHALLPHKFVLHLHALDVLALLIRTNARSEIERLMPPEISWGFVEYVKPGPELAKATAKVIQDHSNVDVLFLQNHGVVVAGDSVFEIRSLLEVVRNSVGQPRVHKSGQPSDPILELSGYAPLGDYEINELVTEAKLISLLEKVWAVAPDHVVFLGPKPFIFEGPLEFDNHISEHSEALPLLAFVKGVGIFTRGRLDDAGEAQVRAYFELIVRQEAHHEFNKFTDDQVAELLNWDAEQYRLAMRK